MPRKSLKIEAGVTFAYYLPVNFHDKSKAQPEREKRLCTATFYCNFVLQL